MFNFLKKKLFISLVLICLSLTNLSLSAEKWYQCKITDTIPKIPREYVDALPIATFGINFNLNQVKLLNISTILNVKVNPDLVSFNYEFKTNQGKELVGYIYFEPKKLKYQQNNYPYEKAIKGGLKASDLYNQLNGLCVLL